MRATIETHESSTNLPPIKVMVSLGDEDLTIKVSCNLKRKNTLKGQFILKSNFPPCRLVGVSCSILEMMIVQIFQSLKRKRKLKKKSYLKHQASVTHTWRPIGNPLATSDF